MSLENVFAIGKKHKVGNMEVEIKQVALGDLPLLTEVASKFMGSKGKSTKENIMSLIQKDFHLVKEVFSVMTDINQEDVSKLNLAASIEILTLIVEENKSFLLEALPEAMERLSKSLSGLSKSKN